MSTKSSATDVIQAKMITATSRVVPMHLQIQALKMLVKAKKKIIGARRPPLNFVEASVPDVNTLALEDINLSNPFYTGKISGVPTSSGSVMRHRCTTKRTVYSDHSGR